MFDDLLTHAGVEEIHHLDSAAGLMAIHGGSLEEGTDVVAAEAARMAEASLYAVVLPPDLRWHIPSRLVSPDHSPALAAFLDHVDVALSVHGFGRAGLFTSILLGGRNRELAALVADRLRPRLAEYDIVDDLDRIPPELRGLHPDNPVNRPRGGGVQIELPPRVRGMGPYWADADLDGRRAPHTEALIEGLATAAREMTR